MTLNPFDPEGRFYWGLGFLAVGAIFACFGVFAGVNSLLFSLRAEPVEVTVVALEERDGQNATLLAPVFEVRWDGEVVRDTSSTATLRPLHRVGERHAGYLKPGTGRIESARTLRGARTFGMAMGGFGLMLGLFGIYLLGRKERPS
ncbi:MAG: DUF3592 domain-containing protein [Pseudomonadota bacterium]